MQTIKAQLGQFVSAVDMIREDHKRVKALFREFEGSDDADARSAIAVRAIDELELHALLEEQIFYPAAREALGSMDALVDAHEAHHAAKMLMQELKLLPSGRRFQAKFKLLMDNVLAHMKEEETVLLPAMEASDCDLHELGHDMALLKFSELESAQSPAPSGMGLGTLVLGAAVAYGLYALFTSSSER